MTKAKVIEEYASAFDDPMKLIQGDMVDFTDKTSEWPGWIWCIYSDDKAGWVPEDYLVHEDDKTVLKCDYDATELTVSIDEELIVIKEEAGWFWCQKESGQLGWIPKENVMILEE